MVIEMGGNAGVRETRSGNTGNTVGKHGRETRVSVKIKWFKGVGSAQGLLRLPKITRDDDDPIRNNSGGKTHQNHMIIL